MIEQSVDWNKVVELIQKIIPNKNVSKIQNISDSTKVNEYKTLVNFLFSKLSYSQKSKVNYLKYWQTTNTERLNKAKDIASDADGEINWLKIIGWGIAIIIALRACAG